MRKRGKCDRCNRRRVLTGGLCDDCGFVVDMLTVMSVFMIITDEGFIEQIERYSNTFVDVLRAAQNGA